MVEKLERIGDQGHIYLILTLTSTSNLPLLLFLEFIEILNFISLSFPPPPLFSIFLQGEEIPFKLDLIGFSFSFVHVNFISFGSSFCHPMYQDYAPFCTFLMKKKKIHYYIKKILKCFPCIPPSHALGFFLFFFFFFFFPLNTIYYLSKLYI